MRTSVIARQDISSAILIFLVISAFVFVAGALYVIVDVLPSKSVPLLSGLVAGMIILTAMLAWQPKVAMPLLIVSIFFSPDIVMAQIPGREVNLRIEDGILVAALLGLFIRYAAGREKISIRTPLDKPILAYCAVGLLSTLVGMYLGNVSPLRGFFFFAKRVEYFLLFYLLCHCLEEKREIKIAIYLILICALGISVYDVYMRFTVGQESWRGFSPLGGSTRVTEYGEILVLIIPLMIAVAIETRSSMQLVAAPFALFFMTYFLLDTLRRSAFLAVAAALLFLAIYKYRLLLPLFAGAFFYFSIRLPENIAARINLLWLEVTQYPFPGGSLPDRVAGIQVAIDKWLYSPLIGKGLGAYSLAATVSHTQYTQVILETGLLGLGCFLWFIVSIVRLCSLRSPTASPPLSKGAGGCYGSLRSPTPSAYEFTTDRSGLVGWNGAKNTTDNLYRGFCIGFLAGTLGYLVMSLGTIPFSAIRTMNVFIIITAILVAYSRIAILDGDLWEQYTSSPAEQVSSAPTSQKN